MMLTRHTTAERLNEIVNHPEVYPWVKGGNTGPMDLSRFVSDFNNVCLVGDYGSVIFQKHQPGIYEFHTCVLPEGRGAWMVEGAKEAFRWMFTRTDAVELMTKCPDGNIASKAGARAVGCSMVFRTGPVWPTEKSLVPVDVWSIAIQNWPKNCPDLADTGKLFHDRLHTKYLAKGRIEPIHEEDETHNVYVGAAAEMMQNGQTAKAVSFYNRWARLAGYMPISVSYEPVLDIFESNLRLKDGDFEVI